MNYGPHDHYTLAHEREIEAADNRRAEADARAEAHTAALAAQVEAVAKRMLDVAADLRRADSTTLPRIYAKIGDDPVLAPVADWICDGLHPMRG